MLFFEWQKLLEVMAGLNRVSPDGTRALELWEPPAIAAGPMSPEVDSRLHECSISASQGNVLFVLTFEALYKC